MFIRRQRKCLFCHDDIPQCVQQDVIKNDVQNVYKVKSVWEHWIKQLNRFIN